MYSAGSVLKLQRNLLPLSYGRISTTVECSRRFSEILIPFIYCGSKAPSETWPLSKGASILL
jgi:hypothetical protein